jgi:hypothetical protein
MVTGALVAFVMALQSGTEPASAPEILKRMADTYRSALTYSDSGYIRTTFIDPDGSRRVTERRFATRFVRPDRFRFEFSERSCCQDENRYIIWMDGSSVRKWWEIDPKVKELPDLESAVYAAAGVSGGVSMRVPTLLLPETLGEADDAAFPLGLEAPSRIADGDVEGTPCFRIRARTRIEDVVVWVEKSTYLIRRVDGLGTEHPPYTDEEGTLQPGFRTEDTTVYSGAVDGAVSDDALAFGVPKAGGLTMQ